MRTLYKNSRLIAATILGTFVFSAGAAVAVTKDAHRDSRQGKQSLSQVEDMGRFVVTPKGAAYAQPAKDMGRFVVSQHGAVFVPVVTTAAA